MHMHVSRPSGKAVLVCTCVLVAPDDCRLLMIRVDDPVRNIDPPDIFRGKVLHFFRSKYRLRDDLVDYGQCLFFRDGKRDDIVRFLLLRRIPCIRYILRDCAKR